MNIRNMSTATKPQRGENTAFIRQHPQLKASELVAEENACIKLTPTQICNCRAIDRKEAARKASAISSNSAEVVSRFCVGPSVTDCDLCQQHGVASQIALDSVLRFDAVTQSGADFATCDV